MQDFGLGGDFYTLVSPFLDNPHFAIARWDGPLAVRARFLQFSVGTQTWEFVVEFPPPPGHPHFPFGFDCEPDLHG